VDDERPESVETALATLAADPEGARRMGAAGRRHAVETFSPEHHAAEVEAIYLEILARRGRPS
jgi:glycosyltransferase involved in cell wall biosynthesis